MLLTTVEVKTFEDAQKRVEWYSGRWGIEVYHRTLKSGCRIIDRQLETADRLQTCLCVDMVAALADLSSGDAWPRDSRNSMYGFLQRD